MRPGGVPKFCLPFEKKKKKDFFVVVRGRRVPAAKRFYYIGVGQSRQFTPYQSMEDLLESLVVVPGLKNLTLTHLEALPWKVRSKARHGCIVRLHAILSLVQI